MIGSNNQEREQERMNIFTDVHNIVAEYLDKNGYDGLYQPGECACLKDNLAPCGEIKHDCIAGYLSGKKTDDCDFIICQTRS